MAKLKNKNGFTLIELLVVISIIALLLAILVPALTKSKIQARSMVCRSNLRQIVLANTGYSSDNDGFFVAAAEDYWLSIGFLQGGYHRWHGVRQNASEPFDPLKGPLIKYLADGKIKECPQNVDFIKDLSGTINFELGCGGYGYNMQYVGSRLWLKTGKVSEWKTAHAKTTNTTEIKNPAATLMFCDTAFYQQEKYLIEYSFAQPPFWVADGQIDSTGEMLGFPQPSIHFRHKDLANVGWADCHIETQKMANKKGILLTSPGAGDSSNLVFGVQNIGWFDPLDNSLFDLK